MEAGEPIRAVVVGGGPAGLMAAEQFSAAGVPVDLYDAMPSVARKFLLAGIGGMNITHSEPLAEFSTRYREASDWLAPLLNRFGPEQLVGWIHQLGVETFTGSSGRVFPTEMKAAPLLRRWKHRLTAQGVRFHPRHRWTGYLDPEAQMLEFDTPAGIVRKEYRVVVLALGGGSWKKLGSDGLWCNHLERLKVSTHKLKPANCGFTVAWSEHLKAKIGRAPLKQIGLSLNSGESLNSDPDRVLISEIMLTEYGLEGTGIYALSADIRNCLDQTGQPVELHIDLLPQLSASQVVDRLDSAPRKASLATRLKRTLKLSPVALALLNETSRLTGLTNAQIAARIKDLRLSVGSPRPIDEAISTAGGVARNELDSTLMLQRLPGVFVAGEMIDWEAPTGGYLLTACFATGVCAGQGALHWLQRQA